MGQTITLDPVTRLEGHLKVQVEYDEQTRRVASAHNTGTLFRGFEILLKGKDPRDAIHITQRVCGVCPTSHAMASALTLEAAARVQAPDNARIIRNIILGADHIQSHILHFYHLALPCYITGPAMPPWTPLYNVDLRFTASQNQRLVDHYVQALAARRQAHEMGALFAGKLPHNPGYVYGGVTVVPDTAMVGRARQYIDQLISFVDSVYLPDANLLSSTYGDYFDIGRGYGNLISFGVYDLSRDGSSKLLRRGHITDGSKSVRDVDIAAIIERAEHSWYNDSTAGRNPAQGQTIPEASKPDAYSWLKAPRLNGLPYEAGALSRMWMTGEYQRGISVMDRHVARAQETRKVAYALRDWLGQINLSAPCFTPFAVPTDASGFGLTEAPRGALGHWVTIAAGAISSYQILTPTCWNCSPRDGANVPGPLEKALEGTPTVDPAQLVEVLRVVHSFDLCLACAVH
jgi:hydrogenase large subunit